MARSFNSIPALRFHKPTNQWYVFQKGKRIYFGSAKDAAERRYRAFIVASGGLPGTTVGSQVDPSGLILSEALALYRRFAAVRYTDARALSRIDKALAAAAARHSSMPAAEFRGRALREVRDELLSIRKIDEKPLSRRYINHLIQSLQMAFTWLVAEEYVPPDTLTALRAVRALSAGRGGRETARVTPIDPDTVAATVAECYPTVAAMVQVQRLGGMRPGEVIRMRRGEISTRPDELIDVPGMDRQIAALAVDGSAVWMYAPSRHKNLHRGKVRVIALGPQAQALLTPLLAGKGPGDFVFQPAADFAGRSNPMIRPGPCYTLAAYQNAIKRAVRRANRKRIISGLPIICSWSPNRLRHAAATDIRAQFGREDAAEFIGHSGLDVIDVYAEQAIATAARIARKVG